MRYRKAGIRRLAFLLQDKLFEYLYIFENRAVPLIDLPPGRHKLQLVLGDADHLPLNPPLVSKPIYVTVVQTPAKQS